MRTFLKRSMLAMAFVAPVGLAAGGAVSPTQASGGDKQFFMGTEGESCSGTCYSKRHICCTIVIDE